MVVVKKKSTTRVDPTADELGRARTLVDEIGDLKKKVAKLKENPIHGQLAEKTSELKDILENGLGGDEARNEQGERFKAKLGAKSNVRVIKDLAKIREMLGDELFMELASVGIGDLDKYLTPDQLEETVESSRSGSRSLTITATK